MAQDRKNDPAKPLLSEFKKAAEEQKALKQKELERQALRQRELEQKALKQKELERQALRQRELEQQELKEKELEQRELKQQKLEQKTLYEEINKLINEATESAELAREYIAGSKDFLDYFSLKPQWTLVVEKLNEFEEVFNKLKSKIIGVEERAQFSDSLRYLKGSVLKLQEDLNLNNSKCFKNETNPHIIKSKDEWLGKIQKVLTHFNETGPNLEMVPSSLASIINKKNDPSAGL